MKIKSIHFDTFAFGSEAILVHERTESKDLQINLYNSKNELNIFRILNKTRFELYDTNLITIFFSYNSEVKLEQSNQHQKRKVI